MEAIIGSLGPLTHSARDLALFCQAMSDHEPWLYEPQLVEMPWKQSVVDGVGQPEKLVFGILKDDGVVSPHPPIRDALLDVERALLEAGHEVIEWEPEEQQYSWDLISRLYFPDCGKDYIDTMTEGSDLQTDQTKWILSQAPKKALTLQETWKLNGEREAFRTRLASRWNATKLRTKSGRAIDAVLCPVAPTLAPPHETSKYWSYTSFWNLADYPGAVFPLGHFRATSRADSDYASELPSPRNDTEKFIRSQWDPDTYDNAPISLQIVGRRFNEEKVLYALGIVEKALQNRITNEY
jgi:amidase